MTRTSATIDGRPQLSLPDWARIRTPQAVTFYLGVPLLCGLALGWNKVGVGRYLPSLVSVGYWTGFLLIMWLCAMVGSRIVYRLLSGVRPPQLVVITLGVVTGTVLAMMPARWLIDWGYQLAAMYSDVQPRSRLPVSPELAARVLRDVFPGVVVWVLTNLAFDRWLGVPRYRYGGTEDAPAEVAGASTPVDSAPGEEALLRRLPVHMRAPVLAVSAEDHYVRVHTELGTCLVYCRFVDALAQLETVAGIQTHRSHWIRCSAARRLLVHGHARHVVLANGLRLPVSRSYLRDVRNILGRVGASE